MSRDPRNISGDIMRHQKAALRAAARFYFVATQRRGVGIPVITGRARGGETPSLGRPASFIPSMAPSHPARGAEEVDRVTSNWRPGQPVFFRSNVAYAGIIARRRQGGRGSTQNPRGYHATSAEFSEREFSRWQPNPQEIVGRG